MGFMAGASIFAIAAAAASAAASAYSAYQQGQQQSAIAAYNRKVAQNQAIAARQAADAAAEDKRRQTDRILAAQRVRLGASGVSAAEGSPLLVQMDSAEEAMLDIARIRYGGAQAAQAAESEARLQGYYGRIARRNATIGVASSLLTGVSKGAGIYAASRPSQTSAGQSWLVNQEETAMRLR